MPMRWLNAYIAMLPRLRAEESIRRVQEGQIASGAMEKESADETWQAWLDEADPGRGKDDEEVEYPSFML